VVQEFLHRTKASRKELSTRFLAPTQVKEWQKQARVVSEGLAQRLTDLRARAIAYTGVASSWQVEDVAREIGRVSRKIDRLAGKKPTGGS